MSRCPLTQENDVQVCRARSSGLERSNMESEHTRRQIAHQAGLLTLALPDSLLRLLPQIGWRRKETNITSRAEFTLLNGTK